MRTHGSWLARQVSLYRWVGSRRVSGHGEAKWHASADSPEFVYLGLDLEGLEYKRLSMGYSR
jgi:hypothetical protein